MIVMTPILASKFASHYHLPLLLGALGSKEILTTTQLARVMTRFHVPVTTRVLKVPRGLIGAQSVILHGTPVGRNIHTDKSLLEVQQQ